jgi:hypothetical protein
VNTIDILFLILVLYISFIIGIGLKMFVKGIRGCYLAFSLVYPFMCIISIIQLIFIEFFEKDKTFSQKIKNAKITIYISTVYFPILVGSFSVSILKQIEVSKRKKHRTKKPNDTFFKIFNSFIEFYSSDEIEKYKHAYYPG